VVTATKACCHPNVTTSFTYLKSESAYCFVPASPVSRNCIYFQNKWCISYIFYWCIYLLLRRHSWLAMVIKIRHISDMTMNFNAQSLVYHWQEIVNMEIYRKENKHICTLQQKHVMSKWISCMPKGRIMFCCRTDIAGWGIVKSYFLSWYIWSIQRRLQKQTYSCI